MDETTIERAEKIRDAAFLQSIMPTVTEEIDQMTKTVMFGVFQKISKGILTPQEAMSYWMEVYSYHRLNKRLDSRASFANTAIETRRQD